MRRPAILVALALLAGALASAARAQTPAAQAERGVHDYQNLDFEAAAASLRGALARTGPSALTDSERTRALVYLGAADLFGGRRDSAVAAFERLLLLHPQYRIDQLVFPPEVTGLFQQVRATTRAAALVAPPVTRLAGPGDRLGVWLYVTSYHPLDVQVVRPNGQPVRALYQGGVGDSLRVEWDGRAADGAAVPSGQYFVRADSRGADGAVVRSVALPLDVTLVQADTLPWPAPLPDSSFRPEQAPGGSGLGSLLAGLAAAAAVVVLPSVVAGNSSGMNERFVVVGALGVGGIVAFPLQRRPRPLPANIAANQALRLSWQRQVDSLRTENASRRRRATLLVRAGAWSPVATP